MRRGWSDRVKRRSGKGTGGEKKEGREKEGEKNSERISVINIFEAGSSSAFAFRWEGSLWVEDDNLHIAASPSLHCIF